MNSFTKKKCIRTLLQLLSFYYSFYFDQIGESYFKRVKKNYVQLLTENSSLKLMIDFLYQKSLFTKMNKFYLKSIRAFLICIQFVSNCNF